MQCINVTRRNVQTASDSRDDLYGDVSQRAHINSPHLQLLALTSIITVYLLLCVLSKIGDVFCECLVPQYLRSSVAYMTNGATYRYFHVARKQHNNSEPRASYMICL